MKLGIRLLLLLSAVVCVVILVVWVTRSAPAYPVALIQVQDAAGKPVAGAVIKPDGLRPKPGKKTPCPACAQDNIVIASSR